VDNFQKLTQVWTGEGVCVVAFVSVTTQAQNRSKLGKLSKK
jgi:hypothetical protein